MPGDLLMIGEGDRLAADARQRAADRRVPLAAAPHQSRSGPLDRGTFDGVIEKIPYLRELGVTALELMPVFQFDPQEANAMFRPSIFLAEAAQRKWRLKTGGVGRP